MNFESSKYYIIKHTSIIIISRISLFKVLRSLTRKPLWILQFSLNNLKETYPYGSILSITGLAYSAKLAVNIIISYIFDISLMNS